MKLIGKMEYEYQKFLKYIKEEWKYGNINELEINDKFIKKEYAPIGSGHYVPLTFKEFKQRRKEINKIING